MADIEAPKKPSETSHKNILLLGLVSLLNDISSEIIQPILPLFIASLGGGSIAVGFIGGMSDGLPSLLKLFSGYYADRIGRRKPLVVTGYALSGLAKMMFTFATSWIQVFLLKSFERCGKGIRSAPRDAIIADSAPHKVRGRGFGVLRAMDSLGAVIGSAMAYVLWEAGLDFRSIFFIAGAVSFMALVPLIKVKDKKTHVKDRIYNSSRILSGQLKAFIVVSSLFALGNFSYMFFILRAQEDFTGSLSIAVPLLLYLLFNISYSALAYPAGALSDRIGRTYILAFGYILFAAVAVGMIYASSTAGLVILFALYGLVFALVDGTGSAFVSDLSESGKRGTALGVYYGATGFAAIASSLIAGWLWTIKGPEMTFAIGAAFAFMAALAMLIIIKAYGEKSRSPA